MKITIRLSALVALLLAATPAFPCANEYKAPKFFDTIANVFTRPTKPAPPPAQPAKARPQPTPAPAPDLKAKLLLDIIERPLPANWLSREQQLRAPANAENADFKTRNDYAIALLHLGRTKDALGILEALASQHPREYQIIATLGTAYELDGQLEKALGHITKATEINPSSHMGTEWLHVKILEAKIALAKNPDWLKSNNVIGHTVTARNLPRGHERVLQAIAYQLYERLQFVAPPDPTVADLLHDMGTLYAANSDPHTAAALYRASKKFGDIRNDIVLPKLRASH